MYSIGLILTVGLLVVTNLAIVLQSSLISFIPDALDNMFNESFHQHYGSYLSTFGLSTVWSISTQCFTVGNILTYFLIIPLIHTKSARYVTINLKLYVSAITAVSQMFAFFLPSFEFFLLSCVLLGSAMVFSFLATTLYAAELAPQRHRGSTAVIIMGGGTVGHIIALNLTRPGIFGGEDNWYMIPVISLVMCLISSGVLFLTPDSPVTLQKLGQDRELHKSLNFYHGTTEWTGTASDVKETAKRKTFNQILRHPYLRKVTVIMIILESFFVIAPGQVENLFYTRLHQFFGFDANTIMSIGSIQRIITLPLYLFSSFAIDRYGRRFMVMSSGFVLYSKSIVSLVALLISFTTGVSWITQVLGVINDALSTIFSALGITALQTLLLYELVPPESRVTIAQLFNLLTMIGKSVFTFIIPYAFNYFPPFPYILLSLFQPLLLIYLYRNLPETKNTTSGEEFYRDHAKSIAEETTPLLA